MTDHVSIHCDNHHDDYKIVTFERSALGWIESDWYIREGEQDQQLRRPQGDNQPTDIATRRTVTGVKQFLACKECDKNLQFAKPERIEAFWALLDRLVQHDTREVALLTVMHLL